MDNKRKASASRGGAAVDSDHPPAKRRKMPSDFPDLTKHESPESTTAYGLSFLEAIRRTADKYGRGVAGYFEKLPPKEGNEDYYNKIRMPVSLRVIERKLYRYEFANMTELESWLKRMVSNAKEYFPKQTQTFEDAERVRKATSNYMVKTNPAYKKIPNYAATACLIPRNYDVDAELPFEDMPSDVAVGGMQEPPPSARGPARQSELEAGDDDAEGDDEEMPDADAEGEADEEDKSEDVGRGSSTRIVLKRRSARSQEMEKSPSASGDKGEIQYSEVPYKGLSFQQAQEKVLDALMRRQDEDDDWPYFEPFINLPDKSLKDYYQLIDEPMSLKKLLRAVKGMQGRGGATGISHFKNWAAFEEKASLLWNNAFYYNEEGSEIYDLAQELKDAFYEQFNEAKANVDEPPQPKIILRTPSTQTQTSSSAKPKRITIHVGGREDSQSSPPVQAGSAPASEAVHGGASRAAPVNPASINAGQAPPATPAATLKREDSVRQSPAVPPQVSNGYSASAFRPVPQPVNGYPQPHQPGVPNGHAPPAMQQPAILYDMKHRGPGTSVKDALVTNLCIRTPLDTSPERRFVFNVPPHPKLLQPSYTISLNSSQWKLQVVPRMSPALEEQQRAYKLFVTINGQILGRGIPNPRDPIQHGELLYDAQLHVGTNTIVVQMIAALPKGQTLPNGSDAVLEKITIFANVMRQY